MKSGKHKKPACIIISQNNKNHNDNNNNNNDDDNNNNNNDNTNSEVEFGKRPKMSMSYLTGVTHTNFHKITANVQKKVRSYWNGNRIDSNWHSNADTYTAKETVGFRSMLCVCAWIWHLHVKTLSMDAWLAKAMATFHLKFKSSFNTRIWLILAFIHTSDDSTILEWCK